MFSIEVSLPGREEYTSGTIRLPGFGEWHGVGVRFKGYYGSLRGCGGGWGGNRNRGSGGGINVGFGQVRRFCPNLGKL